MSQLADPGHGHSPAAWTAVIIMLVGLSAATVFTFLSQWVLVFLSGGIVLVGWALGFILSALGWGAKGPKYQPKGSH